MADWPVELPQKPQQDGFSAEKMDGRLRTSMSEGPDKVRRRFTAVTESLTCSFIFSQSQLDIFNTFFDSILYGGSLSYTWVHPITGVVRTCRIKDMPKVSAVGLSWQASFVVEVLP